ncbi:hypothetical protein BN1110_00591 [bacterium YEK0313]|nr:hypothetical protein BN1110_00591 [bacterium YEK0313]
MTVHAATLFVRDDRGRIVRENDPDESAGPLAFLAATPDRQSLHLHQMLPDDLARRLAEQLDRAPPWRDPEAEPAMLSVLSALLAGLRSPLAIERVLIHRLPHRPASSDGSDVVASGTAAGKALIDGLRRDGMPAHLVAAGFVGLTDFWAPWCAVLDEGAIASLAFAARLGRDGAEIGVNTFPGWRSRGLAALATAHWAAHPDLAGKALFYTAAIGNLSSRRVAERLGLDRFGWGLRLA